MTPEMIQSWSIALIGGVLIGAAAVWLMAAQGRIMGVSGILAGLLPPKPAAG
ncbi:MAG TPA: YeeE/YedE family protein, partial [Tistrella mobilis]|nr:YeeE/YedE family protein [Tistrella mobilis]